MAEKELISELSDAQVVQDVLAIAEKHGKKLTFEQADKLFGHILQTKSDTAALDGDTLEKLVDEYFA
ncbi:hypothetical protein [Bifidobacterium vespertilionis]|uniref:Uncharacterized protein n=1 Tax=Bifidobacterium vespertilionis TaxID=2562524 RepID=A0A5J5DU74_9BIFI|nr:hypothetical protein [Bifidobacterium vespertilionis]KAA8819542.1 hypothetical protein EMO90_07840 [Bifidobacterium vespertilionis]KAA8823450.1 hypothetical protein EM848_05790 [Bifidobacterium vespertilionis]MBT1180226.1 hypothetical protein [Bifidobacterium vespertilionis]